MVVRRRFSSRKTRKSGLKRKRVTMKRMYGGESDYDRILDNLQDPIMKNIFTFKLCTSGKTEEEFQDEFQKNEKLQKEIIDMFDEKAACDQLHTKVKELQHDQKIKDQEYEDMQSNAVDSEEAYKKEKMHLEQKLLSEKKKFEELVIESKAEIEHVKNENTEKNKETITKLHNLKLELGEKQKENLNIERLLTEQSTQNDIISKENKIYEKKQITLEENIKKLSGDLKQSEEDLKDEKANCTVLLAEQKKKYENAGIDLKNLVAEQERYEKEIVKIKAEYEKDKESADELSNEKSRLESQNIVLQQQQLNLEAEIKGEYEQKQKVYKKKLEEDSAAEKMRLSGEIKDMKTQSELLTAQTAALEKTKAKLEKDKARLDKEKVNLTKELNDLKEEINKLSTKPEGWQRSFKTFITGKSEAAEKAAEIKARLNKEEDVFQSASEGDEQGGGRRRRRTHFKKSFKKKFRQLKRKMTKRR